MDNPPALTEFESSEQLEFEEVIPESPLGAAAKQFVKYHEIMKQVKLKITEAEDAILREMHSAGKPAFFVPLNNANFRFTIAKGKEKIKCDFAGPTPSVSDGGGLF